MPFEVVRQSRSSAVFRARFVLTNYSGAKFEVSVNREVKLLTARATAHQLGGRLDGDVKVVAYESINKISNAGHQAWTKDSGLLSIWILGMFNSSPGTTIVVPIKRGPDSELGAKVTSDFFGAVPPERLRVKEDVIHFSGDGNETCTWPVRNHPWTKSRTRSWASAWRKLRSHFPDQPGGGKNLVDRQGVSAAF